MQKATKREKETKLVLIKRLADMAYGCGQILLNKQGSCSRLSWVRREKNPPRSPHGRLTQEGNEVDVDVCFAKDRESQSRLSG